MKKLFQAATQLQPQLLLLALLAVLLFGNCGGGVREMVNGMTYERHERLRAIILQQRAARLAARRQLHGSARQEEYYQIEQRAAARADSLLMPYGNEKTKFRTRRNKVERQVLRKNNEPLIPPIRMNLDMR